MISPTSTFDEYITNAQLVLDIFTINSYAIIAQITPLISENKTKQISTINNNNDNNNQQLIRLFLQYPATLWSSQVLRGRKDNPTNEFELKVLAALASRSGLDFEILTSTVNNQIDVFHNVKLTKKVK